MSLTISSAAPRSIQAVQQQSASRPFATFQVTSAQLLRDENWRPTWCYEVKGNLAGKPVRLVSDSNKLGDLHLEEGGKSRKLTRAEMLDLRGVLEAYSKAQNSNPPQGIWDTVYAINEALKGPAPMSKFKPTGVETWSGGGWDQGITVNGELACSTDQPSITFRSSSATGQSDLSLFWQHGPEATRARPMVRSELEATVSALTPKATGSDPQARLYAVVLAAAKKQLATMK